MKLSATLAAVSIALLGACAAHDPAPRTSALSRRAASSALPASLFGDTLEGARVDLGGPGPVRLIELWATWCVPCGPAAAVARPVLQRHPQVVAYSLSIDDDRAAVARYVQANQVLGAVLVYPGGVAAATRRGLNQVPMFVALDTRGRVAGTVVGFRPGLGAALDRLLSQAAGRSGRVD